MPSQNASVEITGIAEMEAYLERLPVLMRRKAVKQAVAAACKVVRNAAKARVPVKTGRLKKSISYVVRDYEDVVVGVVGPKRDEANHGRLVEYGHQANGATIGAQPFLRPAGDETRPAQGAAIIASLDKSFREFESGYGKT